MDFLTGIEAKLLAFAAKELAILTKFEATELDARVNSLLKAIQGGENWETAVTAELNTLYKDEVTEGKLIIASFLSFVGRLAKHAIG